jgi:hypothetical protein
VLLMRVFVYHPSWCEVTVVRLGWNGGDGWISLGDVVSHARIC